MTPAVAPWDAIGNDVSAMASILRSAGYRVEVYADWVHPDISEVKKLQRRTDSFWRDPDTLLIYHHSMGWPDGQAVVSEARCRVVIKHHNVTPPRFFEAYSSDHAAVCASGEQATRQLANTPGAVFWGDSQFNVEDLIAAGARREKCRVLAPFHRTEELAKAAPSLSIVSTCRQFKGLKLLFVGGLKPNKGHLGLIRTLAAYRRYADPEAVLILPGTSDTRLASYTEALRRWAAQLGVEAAVVFAGPADESQLRTWYFCSDVFLCLSEHEGFCVPLLESMYFRLPIVAHRVSAIPETVGDAGLLVDQGDVESTVESIVVCQEKDERYQVLTSAGWKHYHQHYSCDSLTERFLDLVKEATQ